MGAAVYFWNYVGKPEAVGDTLLSWICVLVNKKRKKVWLAGPFCLFWTIWKPRNRIVFKDEFFFSLERVKTSFVFLLWIETRKIVQGWPFKYSCVY